jgi:iron-sulfur cluster repair protein YtfE (RIC family)
MADTSMMILIHDALRRDFAFLVEQVAACPAGDTGRATALGHAFEFVAHQLDHHHTGEDEDLWPMVKAKLGGDTDAAAVLDRMQEQHKVIDPGIARVRSAFAGLQSGRGNPAATAEALRELAEALREHLENEEREAVPILARTLDDNDLKQFSRMQVKRGGGMRSGATFFPWLVDGMSKQEARQALVRLPPPVRFLTQRVWRRTYERAAPTLHR